MEDAEGSDVSNSAGLTRNALGTASKSRKPHSVPQAPAIFFPIAPRQLRGLKSGLPIGTTNTLIARVSSNVLLSIDSMAQ